MSARGLVRSAARPGPIATSARSLSVSAPQALSVLALGVLAGALLADVAGLGSHRLWLLLVIAPVTEELVFRTGLQESMLRCGASAVTANVGTAVAFGLVHAALRADAAAAIVALPALVIGAVYARRRRAGPCIVLHAAMNACWLGAIG